MPGRKAIHTAKWDRCVQKVGARRGASNPYAVCTATLGKSGTFKKSGKR